MPRSRLLLALTTLSLLALGAPAASSAEDGGDASLTILLSGNDGLRAQGMDYMIQQIDFFHRDGSRASARYFQKDFRWVPRDSRRGPGSGLSYLIDESWDTGDAGAPSLEALTDAIDRAVATWDRDSCTAGLPLRATMGPGGDVTVFDYLLGTGGLGDPFAADVVVAGLPAGMSEFFGPDTLAFSVTFVFVDGSGVPTDVDGDGNMDTAHNEVYFNRDFVWTTGGGTGFDLETTTLHELGHALGLGHFSAPPRSVMTPTYAGVLHELQPIDHAALCVVRARNRG